MTAPVPSIVAQGEPCPTQPNCTRCESDGYETCRCDDGEVLLKREWDHWYTELVPLIRKATRNDEYAGLAGVPAVSMQALRDVLLQASTEVADLLKHAHAWNDDDYCSICGADGRA